MKVNKDTIAGQIDDRIEAAKIERLDFVLVNLSPLTVSSEPH